MVAQLTKTLADLKVGETARVSCFKDCDLSLKLMDMGCLPGSEIQVNGRAPFGGPIRFCVCGYNLSLRKEEAATVVMN